MAQVVYSQNALANLEGAFEFLAETDPDAALNPNFPLERDSEGMKGSKFGRQIAGMGGFPQTSHPSSLLHL